MPTYKFVLSGTESVLYGNVDDAMTDIFVAHPDADFSEWFSDLNHTWMDITEHGIKIGQIFEY